MANKARLQLLVYSVVLVKCIKRNELVVLKARPNQVGISPRLRHLAILTDGELPINTHALHLEGKIRCVDLELSEERLAVIYFFVAQSVLGDILEKFKEGRHAFSIIPDKLNVDLILVAPAVGEVKHVAGFNLNRFHQL